MDGGAWEAAVHGVAKSWVWLNDFTFTFHFYALEKEMATHSSVLAWRIPGTGEPGGLPSLRSYRVGHDWRDLAAAEKQKVHDQTTHKTPDGIPHGQVVHGPEVAPRTFSINITSSYGPARAGASRGPSSELWVSMSAWLCVESLFPHCWAWVLAPHSGDLDVSTKKGAQLDSYKLGCIWDKVRTAAWETAPQIALRDCSKEAVGEGKNIAF